MKQTLRDNVLAVATDVRYWAEGRAAEFDNNADDLNGWCAIASAELFKKLKEKDIPVEIHYSYDGLTSCHVYLLVDDHIVDVTATQFRQFKDKPIVIMHAKSAEVYDFYNTDQVFHSVEALRKYQKKQRWPAEQVAFAA
jgi:hypothetical protein